MPDKLYHDFFAVCAWFFIYVLHIPYAHTLSHTHAHTFVFTRRCTHNTEKLTTTTTLTSTAAVAAALCALCTALPVWGIIRLCVCARVYGCSFNVRGVLSLSPRSLSPYYYYYMLVLFVLLRFTLSFGFYLIRLRLCLSLSHRRRRVHVFLFVILLRLYFCFLIYARASMRDRERIASLFYILYYVLSFARYVLSLNLRSLALSLSSFIFCTVCCRLRAPVWRV